MLKINNVPCGYQHLFDKKIVFILLHKLIDNKKYQDFYMDSNNKFDLIILDNSAFELGESLDKKLLMEWAHKLKKRHPESMIEVIIPDVYGDKEKTLELMKDFLKMDTSGFNLMAIPQGKNELELIACLNEILKEPRIKCIGLNKLWDKSLLEKIVKPIIERGRSIHRLGVKDLSDWVLFNSKLIRSTDSRILSKIVTGNDGTNQNDDLWECSLSESQIEILRNLINEVDVWQ